MRCFNHDELNAVAVCRMCGRAICMSCARASETAVTCSESCQARAEVLARQLATSAALASTAQRLTRVTPRLYLLLAFVVLVLGAIVASLTQNRVMAATAPGLWLLAGFCIFFALALVLAWWKLRGRESDSKERAQ